jgi:hypothetical protein
MRPAFCRLSSTTTTEGRRYSPFPNFSFSGATTGRLPAALINHLGTGPPVGGHHKLPAGGHLGLPPDGHFVTHRGQLGRRARQCRARRPVAMRCLSLACSTDRPHSDAIFGRACGGKRSALGPALGIPRTRRIRTPWPARIGGTLPPILGRHSALRTVTPKPSIGVVRCLWATCSLTTRTRGYVSTGSGPRSRTTASWVAICCSASESLTQTFQARAVSPMCSS